MAVNDVPVAQYGATVLPTQPANGTGKANSAAARASRGPDPAALTIPIKPGSNLDDTLRRGLQAIYGTIYRNDPTAAQAAVDKAVEAIKPALSKAAANGAAAVQFRVVTVATDYGDHGGSFNLGGVSELGVEAAIVKGGRISSADTAVVDLSGAAIALTDEQITRGQAGGYYQRTRVVTDPTGRTAANLQAYREAQKALEAIRQTSDVLAAYVKGNLQPLRDLIQQQLKGNISS